MAGVPDRRDGDASPDGEQRSPMRGDTRCSPWLASQERTISMRRTLHAGGNSDKNIGLDIQTSPKPVVDEPPFAPFGGSQKRKVIRPARIVLATDQSKALRDRLVAELSDLKSADEAADWVHKNLPAKNTLARRRRGNCRSQLPGAARHDRGRTGGLPRRSKTQAGDKPYARTKPSLRQCRGDRSGSDGCSAPSA